MHKKYKHYLYEILFTTILLMVPYVAAAEKTLTVRMTGAGVAEAKLYVQPMEPGAEVQSKAMVLTGDAFTASIEPSSEHLYRLIFIHRQTQTIVPIYAEGDAPCVEMTLQGSVPVASDNANNKVLSAMGQFVAANDKALWTQRPQTPADIRAMLSAYSAAADSILRKHQCKPNVAQYIKMWAYTSTYNSYISLPNILGVRPDSLPLKASEVMEKPYKVIDTPMASLFPIVPSLVASFLPRKASLTEQMDSLYANYQCRELRDKVSGAVIEKYLSRFDYENKYEEGLAELQKVTEKHGLDGRYVKTFMANRSTVKGSPFPKEVKLCDAEGNVMDFAQFRGKYVYIDLWASWCVPCCREVPHLQKLEKELENKDVVFLSISIDQNPSAWKKKMSELEVHGNQWHDTEGTLGKALNVKGIPFFLIYDKDGKLYMYNAPRPSMGFALKEMLEGLK